MTNDTIMTLALAGLALIFFIRVNWINYCVERYQIEASWWIMRTKQDAETVKLATAVWPFYSVLFRVWRWDWRAFVVHQGIYDEMKEWVNGELSRSDLDWETFQLEMGRAQAHLAAMQKGGDASSDIGSQPTHAEATYTPPQTPPQKPETD